MKPKNRGRRTPRYGAIIRVEGVDSEDRIEFMERLAMVLIEGKTKADRDGRRVRSRLNNRARR
jgi:hypothetical protein